MNDAISYIFSENLFMISGPVLNHIIYYEVFKKRLALGRC